MPRIGTATFSPAQAALLLVSSSFGRKTSLKPVISPTKPALLPPSAPLRSPIDIFATVARIASAVTKLQHPYHPPVTQQDYPTARKLASGGLGKRGNP
jgi:hypothetical protein